MSDDHPGVVIKPPYLYLGALAAGFLLESIRPTELVPTAVQLVVGPLLVLAGALGIRSAMQRFAAAGTNVPTDRPSTTIVSAGPYRFSRNPIYLGLTTLYLGFAVLGDSAWVLALVVPVLLVMRFGVIAREERYLTAKFGEAYRAYQGRVRRWL
jgi:protein-S-isoprenylcysteine O-methyltransferase Ste14